MAEFEDNAVVTVENLNNIAIDLGDTTFSAFSDEKFGVDKLNEITADIVGKGVLNIGNKCEAILDGGTVYIQPGIIVFESGAKVRITTPVAVAAAAGDYIYAYNDGTTGKASIRASAEYPSSGDYVMLAQLDADGAVTDLRQMSVAKTTLSADVENNIVEQEVVVPDHPYANSYEFEVVPSLPSCRIIVLSSVNGERISEYRYTGVCLTEVYQRIYVADFNSSYFMSVKKADGKLVFRIASYTSVNKIKFVLA